MRGEPKGEEMKTLMFVFLGMIAVSGCGPIEICDIAACYYPEKICYNNHLENITDYKITPNQKTQSGIKVDTNLISTNTPPQDLNELDGRIAKIESCIQEVMTEVQNITREQMENWQCLRQHFEPEELKRQCLVIKFVPPIYSECSDWQFIGENADQQYCESKGLEPNAECPCRWRTAIQDENTIITPPYDTRSKIPPTNPPAPYLWELGRMMTSCNNAWASPFARCLSY